MTVFDVCINKDVASVGFASMTDLFRSIVSRFPHHILNPVISS